MAKKSKTYTCSCCEVQAKVKPNAKGATPRPGGWKESDGKLYCRDCKDKNFRVLAAEFPLATPHGLKESERAAYWKGLRDRLHVAWGMVHRLANWSVLELLKAEPQVKYGEKMGKPPKVDLYNLGFTRKQYINWQEWEGCTQSASIVIRRVQSKHNGKKGGRFDVLVRGSAAPPLYRYPAPFPIHGAAWKAFFGDANEPLVEVAIPGGREVLRLRGGPEFHRQRKLFEQLVSGEAVQCEAAIYEKSGGVMVKLVGLFPKKTGERIHTLVVRTNPHAFWVVEQETHQPQVYNRDDIPRRVESHRIFLQRIAEDTKYEKRWPKGKRRHINEYRKARCQKQNDWLSSTIHEMTASVATLCQRRKIAIVVYDDECKSYVDRFPWFILREALKSKLAALGIEFVDKGVASESA